MVLIQTPLPLLPASETMTVDVVIPVALGELLAKMYILIAAGREPTHGEGVDSAEAASLYSAGECLEVFGIEMSYWMKEGINYFFHRC